MLEPVFAGLRLTGHLKAAKQPLGSHTPRFEAVSNKSKNVGSVSYKGVAGTVLRWRDNGWSTLWHPESTGPNINKCLPPSELSIMVKLVKFVSQSGGRGTIPLIHGCLSTIVLCTWNALHLDLPADCESNWTKILRKAKWMILAIIAPEAISVLALREWFETGWILDRIRALESHPISYNQQDDKKDVASVNSIDVAPSERDLETATYGLTGCSWKRTHAYYVNMGGFVLVCNNERYRLCAPQFLALLERKFIQLPSLSKEEIKDKSKEDALTKVWGCIQITWLLAYLVGRIVEHLPITTLELFTVGVACCTFFSYGAWLEKPKDVEFPTEIHVELNSSGIQEVAQLLTEKGVRYHSAGVRISLAENLGLNSESLRLFELTYLIPILLFGTCHLLGWNFWFNSRTEKWLWRASSITCLALPIGTLTLGRVIAHHWPVSGLMLTIVTLYAISRAFLLIEIFSGLRSVPEGIYNDVGWSQWIPHVGS